MNEYIQEGKLKVNTNLYALVNEKILPNTTIEKSQFWKSFENIIYELAPINKELLKLREELQAKIDTWHAQNNADKFDFANYKKFLQDIGYLIEEGSDFKITTQNVDIEIKQQAGPQLVVPIKNARFALNAANARWGSLYDSLYGTDMISETNEAKRTKEYNSKRGAKVIQFAKNFLDDTVPLENASHSDAVSYKIQNESFEVTLKS